VATDEPEMAAKPPQANTVAMPSPPFQWPTSVLAARNSSRLTPGVRDEGAHQQEHRDDAELIVGDGAHRHLADQLQRRRAAGQVGIARDADQPHRHADRHAQQHQREQGDEAQDGDGIGAHRSAALST
jgi:hypothetical protein